MRIGLYELQVLSQDGVVLNERCIAGNNFVEAKTGEEYKVKVSIHRDSNTRYVLGSCVAYLSIDGTKVRTYKLLHLNDNSWVYTRSKSETFRGYPYSSDSFKAFLFSPPTSAKDYDNTDSATGQLRIEFYEVERCLEQYGNLGDIPREPAPVNDESENKKPTEQPSLRTTPGRVVPYNLPVATPPAVKRTVAPTYPTYQSVRAPSPPRPVYSWKRIREEPDAIMDVKCHTFDTLDFIQRVYDAHLERIAANLVPMDLTAEDDPVLEIQPPAKPPALVIDIESEPRVVRVKVEPQSSSSSSMMGVGSGLVTDDLDTACETFDFALPAGASSAHKPALRLKNRASKSTKHKLKAAAVHAAGTKRKASAIAEYA